MQGLVRSRSLRVLLVVPVGMVLGVWVAASAQAEPAAAAWTPVQLSLTERVQLFDQDTSVTGVRLGVLSSRNRDVVGLDLAALASRSSGDEVGLQASLYCEIEGDLVGAQLGIVSADTDGVATGVQSGTLSRAGELIGLQVSSVFNRARAVTGVQISLVNYAEDLEGVQIGLVNVHRNGWLPVMPGLNIGFGPVAEGSAAGEPKPWRE